MRFSREVVCADFFEEIAPLMKRHYLEVAHYQDIPLQPNFDRYIEIEKAGNLRTFTARDEYHRLLGYAIFFVNFNMHYSDSLQAVQDVIYLEKSQRGHGIGKDFILWCDQKLSKEGCQVVYHHVKDKHNFGPLLEGIGYRKVDLIFAKRLDFGS